MKTYACLKCGKTLESSESIQMKGRLLTRRRCPGCGAPVGVSGAALIVASVLWMVLWGMILCPGAVLVGIVGAIVFLTVGVMRLIRQFRIKRRTVMAVCVVLALLVIAFWVGRANGIEIGVESRIKQRTQRDLVLHKELVELDRSFLINVATRPNTMTSGLYTLEVRFAGKSGYVSEHELEFSDGRLIKVSTLPKLFQTGNVVSWGQADMDEGPTAKFVGLIDGNVMWGRVYVPPGQGWQEGEPPEYGVWRLYPKTDQ